MKNLSLLYEANKEIFMAVKTSRGLSARQVITNSVLQGDTFGSILASVQVDRIGQKCLQAGHFYLYKDSLQIGFLGLVDDIVGITNAGADSLLLNSFINIRTAEKGLQFGPSKCNYMLIGKSLTNVHQPKLEVDSWETRHSGQYQSFEEWYSGKVNMVSDFTYLGFTVSSSGDNMANIRRVKNKSLGVIAKLSLAKTLA